MGKRLSFVATVLLAASAGYAQSALDLVDDDIAAQILEDIEGFGLVEPTNVLGAMTPRGQIRLRFLDRLNGTHDTIDMAVGSHHTIKQLDIGAEACYVPADDGTSDAVAFLTIQDEREEAPSFRGWMIASSPALSALDHPRYDVWVVSCADELGAIAATNGETLAPPARDVSALTGLQ